MGEGSEGSEGRRVKCSGCLSLLTLAKTRSRAVIGRLPQSFPTEDSREEKIAIVVDELLLSKHAFYKILFSAKLRL